MRSSYLLGWMLSFKSHDHVADVTNGELVSADYWVRHVRGGALREKLVEHEELLFPEAIDFRRARAAYRTWKDDLYSTEWNVYCKPPFGGSEKGLEYLARYTHCRVLLGVAAKDPAEL